MVSSSAGAKSSEVEGLRAEVSVDEVVVDVLVDVP